MIEKLRATRDSDKLERRGEILDAAERLFIERRSGLASMDELAQAAGVAKGTLYLYFPSKEEVLLALHERHTEEVFGALSRRMADEPRLTLDELFDVVRKHLIDSPTFLPVATLVVGYMERSLPLETVIRFRTSFAPQVMQVGAQLEGALDLPSGEGPRMIQYSFALIFGLWQITSSGRLGPDYPVPVPGFVADFAAEVRRGLDALWRGIIGAPAAARKAASARRKTRPAARTGKDVSRRRDRSKRS